MSLANRIIRDSNSKITVHPNPDNPDGRLLYRCVRIAEPSASEIPYMIGDYNTVFPLKKGEVLELVEHGEDPVFCTVDGWQPKFTVYVKAKKNTTELSFSTNPGINLSRVMIEDPQKRLYCLGTSGTLDSKAVWLLPSDISFSKSKENSNWHIRLDRYSSCIYDFVIE